MTLPYLKRKTRQMADLSRKMTVNLSNGRVGIASTIPVSTLDIGFDVDSTGLTGNLTGIARTATSLNPSATHTFTGNMIASKFVGFGSALTGVGYTAWASVMDRKDASNGGGDMTSGAWRDRDLNAWIDSDDIVSLSSNEFTLQAGTYMIEWICAGYAINRNKTRLYNVTDGEVPNIGPNGGGVTDNAYYGSFNTGMPMAHGCATRLTLTSAKAFKIQHYCSNTQTSGFGIGSADSAYWPYNYYTMVWIYKGG